VFGAVAADASGNYLAPLGYVGPKGFDVLVIDGVDMVGAKATNLTTIGFFLAPAAAGILVIGTTVVSHECSPLIRLSDGLFVG
jgi:hypothetical protein